MKLRDLLLGTAMMSLTLISAKATTPPEPSPLIAEDKVLKSAYYDTLSILGSANACSEFFGGPSTSVEIFNSLIAQVRKAYFSSAIGIRMSGQTINVSNAMTNSRYRLFDKVTINSNGPFYRNTFSTSRESVPGIGSYQANTKEGRVLMFLHELGHVVKGQTGHWLLRDDGDNDTVSRSNTRKIEGVCGNRIKNLGKGDLAMNSTKGKHKPVDEKSVAVDTSP